MKSFIVNVYKNKKWITLGLSILYLLLFCFPMITFAKSYEEVTYEDLTYYDIIYGKLPLILYLAKFIFRFPSEIKSLTSISDNYNLIKAIHQHDFTIKLICSIFMLTCFVLAIVCIVRSFKGKKFHFISSITFAFLTMLVFGIQLHHDNGTWNGNDYEYVFSYSLHFYPTTYIFLALLILDIVYLCLERYYLHGGQEKHADRKAARQAKQDAEYKQSPEYRIEQLEKELQDLKSQVKSDEDKE